MRKSNLLAGRWLNRSLAVFGFTTTRSSRAHRRTFRRTVAPAVLLCLLFYSHESPVLSAHPEIIQVSVSGSSLSITSLGSPGDLQFLIRNYVVPENNITSYVPFSGSPSVPLTGNSVSNAENAILVRTVGTNGLAEFTTELSPEVSFFRVRTVVNGLPAGNGTNDIRVISSPEDLVLPTPGPAAFMVAAEGTTTNVLGYQWFKNGAVIPGATNATYTFSAGLLDSGSFYSCDVNMLGYPPVRVRTAKSGSPDARLVVGTNIPPATPVIVGDGRHAIRVLAFPKDTVITNTGIASFSVVAQGTVTNLLQYQWFWNEIPIPSTNNPTATTSTLVITNAHFDPGATTVTPPAGYTRATDVGFYSCNVNMVGHPAVRVRSADTNATGALLSLFTGTNTTLYSAYASRSWSSCLGNYSGYVKFRNNDPTHEYNTLMFSPPPIRTGGMISDASVVTVPLGTAYTRTVYFNSILMDSCRFPWGPLPLGMSSTNFSFSAPGPTFKFSVYVLSPSPFPTGAQFALNKNWTGP